MIRFEAIMEESEKLDARARAHVHYVGSVIAFNDILSGDEATARVADEAAGMAAQEAAAKAVHETMLRRESDAAAIEREGVVADEWQRFELWCVLSFASLTDPAKGNTCMHAPRVLQLRRASNMGLPNMGLPNMVIWDSLIWASLIWAPRVLQLRHASRLRGSCCEGWPDQARSSL